MDHFQHRDGRLFCEEVSLDEIADEVGTPVYVYSTATLERHYRVFAEGFAGLDSLVAYSVKSNSNVAVVRTLAKRGAGADVVSEGEMRRALAAGVPASKIVFAGVGKTHREIEAGLEAGIHQFNAESEPELAAIATAARARAVAAPVAIRVNPNVAAGGHAKISTGKSEDKFGVPIDRVPALYARASAMEGLAVKGLAVHIGSQITEIAPFERAFAAMAALVRELRAAGLSVERLDLGGGLGVPYDGRPVSPSPADYAAAVRRATEGLDVDLIFEPGRMIAGNAGVLVAGVTYVKEGVGRRFLILDSAMNDLLRPALYDADHDIAVLANAERESVVYDVVGPVCETADRFVKERSLPRLEPGDRIAFKTAGAYGAVQAGEYNTRPLVPEVLVNGADWAVVRQRPSYEEIIGRDVVPAWL
ncbi:MAG: diaminopimelate decarboxylase [Pseudomonadota bacterium]